MGNVTLSDLKDQNKQRIPTGSTPSVAGDYLLVPLRDDVDAIQIERIVDTKGRVADLLDYYSNQIDSAIIPLKMTSVLPQIQEIKRYDLVSFRNQRFAYRCKARADVIEEYTNKIIKCLREGVPFTESLWYKIEFEGKTYDNLKLSPIEWQIIISKFRLYNAAIYKTDEDEDLILIVDGGTL